MVRQTRPFASNITNVEPAATAHPAPLKAPVTPGAATQPTTVYAVQKPSQPIFGKPSAVGKFRPAPASMNHGHNLYWSPDQTAEFFSPQVVQEAHRQAAWQQYFQYQAYMQACMTPEQYQQWQLSQHYQHYSQHYQQHCAMMHNQQTHEEQRKPRTKKAPAASKAPEPESDVTPPPATSPSCGDCKPAVEGGVPEQAEAPAVVVACTPDPVVMEHTCSKYGALSRPDLVALAKEHGIKANSKTADIIKVTRPSFDECSTANLSLLTPLQQALEKLDNDKKEAEKEEAAPAEQQEVPQLESLMLSVSMGEDKPADDTNAKANTGKKKKKKAGKK